MDVIRERRVAFSQIAGHPALDLVNTVEWRLSEARFEEDLVDYADLVRWSRQLALVSADEADALETLGLRSAAGAAKEAAKVRALREAIYEALFHTDDATAVTDEYRDAVKEGRLSRTDDEWTWEFPVDLALPRRRIALVAFDLFGRDDLSRLGQCRDAECGWVFLDTSPRHNRRWCVSADCGNRNRVREYYERSKTAT